MSVHGFGTCVYVCVYGHASKHTLTHMSREAAWQAPTWWHQLQSVRMRAYICMYECMAGAHMMAPVINCTYACIYIYEWMHGRSPNDGNSYKLYVCVHACMCVHAWIAEAHMIASGYKLYVCVYARMCVHARMAGAHMIAQDTKYMYVCMYVRICLQHTYQ